ncbi:hypothetical protein RIF29_00233 [Crotalaria pallida]|uniref:Serine-threonine/tyrosine-protein kinase catalytic domain-containing protein n=1 Tax=Crotalaria pallida TaxID=3830 RepID=A0AAN9P746_CROPI
MAEKRDSGSMSEGKCETVSISEGRLTISRSEDGNSLLRCYLPPEFFMQGIVDEKTDVYAYGVLLLELIKGREALDSSQKSLVMWVLQILRGEEETLEMIKESQKSKLQRTYSVELNDAEEYNSTKFLSESDRYMATILSSSNSIKEESTEN